MDTSEQYQKMADCPEIQGLKPILNMSEPGEGNDEWLDGDWFVIYPEGEVLVYAHEWHTLSIYTINNGRIDIDSSGFCDGDGWTVDRVVWLPRQDQLQEMVDTLFRRCMTTDNIDGIVKMIYTFEKWCRLNWVEFNSMEQLWLAFVMAQLYSKTWDGKKWRS